MDLDKYKSIAITKGFQQIEDIDYIDIFNHCSYSITDSKMDVQIAWCNHCILNGDIVEEVYMIQPQVFVNSQFFDYVCKLVEMPLMAWNKYHGLDSST